MMLAWHWPWAALAGVLATLAIIVLIVVFARRNAADDTPVFSMDDDLNTEHASRLFRQWRALGRLAISVLVLALALAIVLVARPSQVDAGDERASSRDIVLCLDVSGSTLPYDREVIDTYLELVKHFEGERIGLSIFNSTSRTVFPLTDDYELVTKQLTSASKALKGVESQDDIDKMSDAEYQDIANWLEGTQNRKDATSLIGLRGDAPRFRLWRSQSCECRPSACGIHRAGHRQRRVGQAHLFADRSVGFDPADQNHRGRPVFRAESQ